MKLFVHYTFMYNHIMPITYYIRLVVDSKAEFTATSCSVVLPEGLVIINLTDNQYDIKVEL